MRNFVFKITLSLFTILFTTSCGANNSNEEGYKIERVSIEEFKKNLEGDVQIVDVRTAQEFNGGTIEGAVNIDFSLGNFEAEINKLDKSKKTLIFCQAGGRSAKALKKFEANGFSYVLELKGGFGNYQ